MAALDGSQERTWGMLCHVSAFAMFLFPFGNILGPLIVWLIKRDESAFVDSHGKEAVNFQISMTLYLFAAVVMLILLIGFLILPILGIADIVLAIVGAVKAGEGADFHYPLSIRFIR